jgi:[protein-PII] uridylyltransferase
MNTYGVLGLYVPGVRPRRRAACSTTLFHCVHVDAHTLFVVENLRRFALPRFDKNFPACSLIMQRLEKPEVRVSRGLFHDIAKGAAAITPSSARSTPRRSASSTA